MLPTFVIKAEELAALNYLEPDHPRPLRLEWINRGTNQELRRTTIDLLLRTLYCTKASPSVIRLHQSAGLRATFPTETDRISFKSAFDRACAQQRTVHPYLITAIFDNRAAAERAVSELIGEEVPASSVSLLWLAGRYMEAPDQQGHSKASVAAAVAGGGVAGAILGVAVFAIPGLGPVVAAGAIVASASSTLAAVSAAIGATGGAIARMLTDHDVDGRAADFYDGQVRRGRVFVSVDTRIAVGQVEIAREVLLRLGGQTTHERAR